MERMGRKKNIFLVSVSFFCYFCSAFENNTKNNTTMVESKEIIKKSLEAVHEAKRKNEADGKELRKMKSEMRKRKRAIKRRKRMIDEIEIMIRKETGKKNKKR